MKTLLAVAFAAVTLASIASAAQARPHKVCYVHHHHRVCHWVR